MHNELVVRSRHFNASPAGVDGFHEADSPADGLFLIFTWVACRLRLLELRFGMAQYIPENSKHRCPGRFSRHPALAATDAPSTPTVTGLPSSNREKK